MARHSAAKKLHSSQKFLMIVASLEGKEKGEMSEATCKEDRKEILSNSDSYTWSGPALKRLKPYLERQKDDEESVSHSVAIR